VPLEADPKMKYYQMYREYMKPVLSDEDY